MATSLRSFGIQYSRRRANRRARGVRLAEGLLAIMESSDAPDLCHNRSKSLRHAKIFCSSSEQHVRRRSVTPGKPGAKCLVAASPRYDILRPGAAAMGSMNTTRLIAEAMERYGIVCETSPIRSSSRWRACWTLLAWWRQGRNNRPEHPGAKATADHAHR